MANPIQLYGAQIKRAQPEVLQGEWFTDSLRMLAGIGNADLLDEGDSFTVEDFPRVKVPREADAGWKFDIPSVDQHGEPQDVTKLPVIDGIIMEIRNARLYWKSAYGDGSTGPPNCKSTDGITGEGSPGGDCHTCPLNRWGSAAAGNGKACAQRTELYILTPLSPFPIVVSAPPTSQRALRQYRLNVFGQSGLAYHKVVTRLDLEAAQNADGMDYVVIKPKLLALPSAKEAEAIAKVREDFVTLIRGSDVVVDIEETDTPARTDVNPAPPPDSWNELTPIQRAAAACVNEPRGLWGDTTRDILKRHVTEDDWAEIRALVKAQQAETSAIAEAGGVGDELPF